MPVSFRRMTPESFVAAFLAGPAAMMAAGYLLDAIGLPMAPALLAGVALVASIAAFLVVREATDAPAGSVLAFGAVVASALAYLCWLASPSLLPVTDGPDVVHHLQLIHFIERTHRLPHDPALGPYLGEMVHYTPGSHIVAAMAGAWLGVDPLRVLFPVTAAFVAVKAGVVYALALRLIPAVRGAAIAALAAPILLLVPSAYVIGAFFKFYFYSQVVSETFAIAMVLAAIGWMRTGLRVHLWFAAACGVGIVLSWPVWIVPAGTAVAAAILFARSPVRADGARPAMAPADGAAAESAITWRVRLTAAAVVFAPCVLFAVWHTLAHSSGASIVRSAGEVLRPSLASLGIGFVVLAAAGVAIAATVAIARPLAILLVAAVGVALALAPLTAPSYYMPSKMVYLAVVPGAVLGAIVLAWGAAGISRVPRIGVAAPLLPVLVAALLASGRFPVKRQSGPLTESSLAAGAWARVLPPGCVDYFSRHWLTGYWLHLDVLGNPRDSDRMRVETFEFHDTVSRWLEGRGLPYAIVEDIAEIPRDLRPEMLELRAFPPAAVVKNRRPGSDPKITLCAGK